MDYARFERQEKVEFPACRKFRIKLESEPNEGEMSEMWKTKQILW